MDYVKFFGFEREPFQNDLDLRFYFEGASQRRARMQVLRAGQQRKGMVLVLGQPGLGKSTLAHQLRADLEGDRFAARLLVSSHRECSRGWFLPQFGRLFGIENPAARIPELIDQIREQLLRVRLSGRHPVLLIDEAQLLGEAQTLEEFRALLNLSHDGQRVFTLVLFGMEELGGILSLDPSLAQRVDVRVRLQPFSAEESGAYLAHRLSRAGGDTSLFTAEAVDALYRYSGGVLRVLNTLADNAMFEASLDKAAQLGAEHVTAAAAQLDLRPGVGGSEPGVAAAAFRSPAVEPIDGPAASPQPIAVADVPLGLSVSEDPPASDPAAEPNDWLDPVAPVLDEVLKTFEDAAASEALGETRVETPTCVPSLVPPEPSELPRPAARDAENSPADGDLLDWGVIEHSSDPLLSMPPDAPRAQELAGLPESNREDDSMANLSFCEELELTPAEEIDPEGDSESLEEVMLDEVVTEVASPVIRPQAQAKGPRIDLPEDDDLDLLFDDIQVEN